MSIEPKKLAPLRILQILEEYTDYDHPLTQEEIVNRLDKDYGLMVERKLVGRNLSILKEAGYDIESDRRGSYLAERPFEDSELRLLIDGVLSSRYITAKHSKDLIKKLCGLSNKYFLSHVKHICSVNDWSKTDNSALFYSIEVIDTAIEEWKQIAFHYNKYGADKKLHKTSEQRVSPYQLILHNQRYYLVSCNEKHKNLGHYRLDRITEIRLLDEPATPLKSLSSHEFGIDYHDYATSLPYMYADKPEVVDFLADEEIVDQIVDWFGDKPGGDPLSRLSPHPHPRKFTARLGKIQVKTAKSHRRTEFGTPIFV